MPIEGPKELQKGGFDQKPDRMYITDLQGLVIRAQYNPAEFEEQLRANWQGSEPVGLSYHPLQYVSTENKTLALELVFDAGVEGQTLQGILEARRFLMSLLYPRAGARSVREGQAVRVLFVWPGFMALNCVVRELGFKYEAFNVQGTPTRYKVNVKLEAIYDHRLYHEEIKETD